MSRCFDVIRRSAHRDEPNATLPRAKKEMAKAIALVQIDS